MHDSLKFLGHIFFFFILFIIYIWASILGQHAHKTKSTTKPQVQMMYKLQLHTLAL